MVRWYYNQRIGEVYTKQKDGKVYKANIFGGNCLCVFTILDFVFIMSFVACIFIAAMSILGIMLGCEKLNELYHLILG